MAYTIKYITDISRFVGYILIISLSKYFPSSIFKKCQIYQNILLFFKILTHMLLLKKKSKLIIIDISLFFKRDKVSPAKIC